MKLKRLVVSVILLGLIGTGVWYFLIREGDVRARFNLVALPGTIFQSAKLWATSDPSVSDFEFEKRYVFNHKLEDDSVRYTFRWEVFQTGDSTSQIVVNVTSDQNSFSTRLQSLFSETTIEKLTTDKLKEFYEKIGEHLDKFRVEVIGEARFDSTFCLYVPLSTSQYGKAGGMMGNDSFISEYIIANKLKPAGMPTVQIHSWDEQEDQLIYDLCYPIAFSDTLKNNELVSYKWIEGFDAVQANYYGN